MFVGYLQSWKKINEKLNLNSKSIAGSCDVPACSSLSLYTRKRCDARWVVGWFNKYNEKSLRRKLSQAPLLMNRTSYHIFSSESNIWKVLMVECMLIWEGFRWRDFWSNLIIIPNIKLSRCAIKQLLHA